MAWFWTLEKPPCSLTVAEMPVLVAVCRSPRPPSFRTHLILSPKGLCHIVAHLRISGSNRNPNTKHVIQALLDCMDHFGLH